MTRQTSFVYIISDRTESADSDTYSVSSVNNAHMELTSVTSMNSTIQHLYCLLYSSGAHYKNISCTNKQQQPTALNNPTTIKTNQLFNNSNHINILFNNPTCKDLTTTRKPPNLQPNSLHNKETATNQQPRKPNNLQKKPSQHFP